MLSTRQHASPVRTRPAEPPLEKIPCVARGCAFPPLRRARPPCQRHAPCQPTSFGRGPLLVYLSDSSPRQVAFALLGSEGVPQSWDYLQGHILSIFSVVFRFFVSFGPAPPGPGPFFLLSFSFFVDFSTIPCRSPCIFHSACCNHSSYGITRFLRLTAHRLINESDAKTIGILKDWSD